MKNQIIMSSCRVGMRDIKALLSTPISRIGCCPQGRDDEGRRGFTLIEMLVVVLIIGILAAIALPQYQLAVARSKYATLKDTTTALKNAQELYYMANGTYTHRFDKLDIDLLGDYEDGNTTDTREERVFSWGKCRLTVNSTYCSNGKNAYHIYYAHSPDNPGKIRCLAWQEDTTKPWKEGLNLVQSKVCQQDTGTDFAGHTSTHIFWWYN